MLVKLLGGFFMLVSLLAALSVWVALARSKK
jgi:hypothetical protein